MEAHEITCYVEGLSQHYVDGLERVELYVCSEFTSFVPIPEPGTREEITLLTQHGSYRGGLRSYHGSVYVCPDLRSDKNRKVTLARILKDNGIEPRQRIALRVADRDWELACR